MEELLELTKKQLRIQKIITTFLAIIVVMLLVAGVMLVNQMNEMSAAMDEVVQKVETLDVDAINDTVSEAQELTESMNEYVTSMNEMLEEMQSFGGSVSGLFGR